MSQGSIDPGNLARRLQQRKEGVAPHSPSVTHIQYAQPSPDTLEGSYPNPSEAPYTATLSPVENPAQQQHTESVASPVDSAQQERRQQLRSFIQQQQANQQAQGYAQPQMEMSQFYTPSQQYQHEQQQPYQAAQQSYSTQFPPGAMDNNNYQTQPYQMPAIQSNDPAYPHPTHAQAHMHAYPLQHQQQQHQHQQHQHQQQQPVYPLEVSPYPSQPQLVDPAAYTQRAVFNDPIYLAQLASLGVTVPPTALPEPLQPLALAALRNAEYVQALRDQPTTTYVDGQPVPPGAREAGMLAVGRQLQLAELHMDARDVGDARGHGAGERRVAEQGHMQPLVPARPGGVGMGAAGHMGDVSALMVPPQALAGPGQKPAAAPRMFVQAPVSGTFSPVSSWPPHSAAARVPPELSLLGLAEGGLAVQRLLSAVMMLLLGLWAGISLLHVLALYLIPAAILAQALPPLLPALSAMHYLCGTACLVLVAWTAYVNYTALQDTKARRLYAAAAGARAGSAANTNGTLFENNTDMPAARARALTPAVASACVFALACMTVALLTTWAAAYYDAQLIVLYSGNPNWYLTATDAQRGRLSDSLAPAMVRCVCALLAWLAVSAVVAAVVFSDAPVSEDKAAAPEGGKSSMYDAQTYALGNNHFSQSSINSGMDGPTIGLQQRSLGSAGTLASARARSNTSGAVGTGSSTPAYGTGTQW